MPIESVDLIELEKTLSDAVTKVFNVKQNWKFMSISTNPNIMFCDSFVNLRNCRDTLLLYSVQN